MKTTIVISLFLLSALSVNAQQELYLPAGSSSIKTSLNGGIGVGTDSPGGSFEIFNDEIANLVLKSNKGFLQIGIASEAGHFASFAKPGDVVFRKLREGVHNLIFCIPNNIGDGNSYFKFGDEKNGGWFSLYNNRNVILDGRMGIGIQSPGYELDINGTVAAKAAIVSESLQLGTGSGMNEYGKKLHFGLSGENTASLWMARYNTAENKTDLRVCIGDDTGGDNRFVIGQSYHGNSQWHSRFVVTNSGWVGINVENPQNALEVAGTIRAKEVKIESTNWPDYVFSKDYRLPSLSEVAKHIEDNSHLPGIPSAKEVEERGISLGDMNAKLLQKIEEMTLYMIEQEKVIKSLIERVELLEQ